MAQQARRFLVLASMLALAACAAPKPPAPPPPPPPAPPPAKVVVIPPRPQPPLGVAGRVPLPEKGPDGVRHTILVDSANAQLVWNLRSAYNVAALDCTGPRFAELPDRYRAFLKTHAKALAQANAGVDANFKAQYGKGYIAQRETYMTKVYNYFAYPPTLPNFCESALAMSREGGTIAPRDLGEFSKRSFAQFRKVYEDFYEAYAAYQVALANWEAQYGEGAAAKP